jgi:hypothetical protein
VQGVEFDQFDVGGAQRVEILAVVEAEGLVVRNADTHAVGRRSRPGRKRNAQRRRAVGNRQQPREIDLRGDTLADLANPRLRGVLLIGRHQSEVAFGNLHAGVVLHRADHLDLGVVLDHRAQLRFVAAAAEVVEDDPGDADIRVERLVAEDQRRHPARHAARVDHQHHRRAQQLGQRRVAVAAVEIEPVVEPLVALDQADPRAACRAGELLLDLAARHHVEIEVVAGALRRHAEPQRIDVVRALLERLHRMAARVQRGGTDRA